MSKIMQRKPNENEFADEISPIACLGTKNINAPHNNRLLRNKSISALSSGDIDGNVKHTNGKIKNFVN